jgi:hypothetical protein
MQDAPDTNTDGAGAGPPAAAATQAPDDKIPFNNDEIEAVAESTLKTCDPDINWGELSARAKHEYKELAVAALRDQGVPDHLKGLIAGEVERAETFQRVAIRTFRESPKWDEDAFVRGYK